MKTFHKVIMGDSRAMEDLADESVYLVVTSPPYWQLKDYGKAQQIGFDDSYEDYINNLNLVWAECHRALHKGCRLCVNIGDQFARSVYYGRYKVIPIRTEIIRFCETIGFDYMGAIIWQKVTTTHTTGGATIMGSYPYPRNGILKIDYEFILIFKKHGRPPRASKEVKEQSRLSLAEWKEYFTGHWTFPGERQQGHLAMFPEELPARLIKMFTFAGEVVLDPFLGSGTTAAAAKDLDRNSIGYEINPEFLGVIKQKLGTDQQPALRDTSFEFTNQGPIRDSLQERAKRLPYRFKDPVRLDKKVDPKQLRFGSRIDARASQREDYHKVTCVTNAELLVLDGGLRIRLVGVRERPETTADAVAFLNRTTRGNRVFLRFDQEKYDKHGNLLCYLYLENKTFLNAQLVRRGLVDVDDASDYRHKRRFLRYWRDPQWQKSGS